MKLISSYEQYQDHYKKSITDPEAFWAEIAEDFFWHKPWDQVLSWDFTKPEVKWFSGAKVNITENCLDRHLGEKKDDTAIIWVPNDPNAQTEKFSYGALHSRVCQMANVLKNNGIKRGDRVCIYLPMVPELAISVLACARIGAIHSVVFAGFSSTSLASRINDAECKMLITADGSFRGAKTLDLKSISDEAVQSCPCIESVLVTKVIDTDITLNDQEKWLDSELQKVDDNCPAEVMDAEDPLFILYTSGSTGRPKGMVHTTGGYMVYTTYSFKQVFQYKPGDIYWCTADIGWITGHSYIVYGPLSAGATTVMFEGVPSYPDYGRFWQICEELQVNQFYTAPTAIRVLAKQPLELVEKYDLSSLKVLGSVGEPINKEAWEWYYKYIGKEKCPIVDTWWQTETGGIMISGLAGVTPMKPTYAGQPMPGIQPRLMDEEGKEIPSGGAAEGRLTVEFPWPSMARTIWGDHERYRSTYFSTFPGKYFTGDGALRDDQGNYRITGRVDDIIIVSGHNLGTAPIENAINAHPAVAESAVVGFPHDIKGNALYGYVILKEVDGDEQALYKEINQAISDTIGPIAKLDRIQFVSGLPKTRSGKIMRRILRKVASNQTESLGDTSTLLNPEVVDEIIEGAKN